MLEKRIQIRRDTETNWNNINPVLALGELAYVTDTKRVKAGDGESSFSSLPYIDDRDFYSTSEADNLLNTKEDKDNKGVANGYPELDSSGKIPVDQLPDVSKGVTTVLTSGSSRPSSPLTGDKIFETDTGDSYIYDGTSWVLMADADWQNVNLDWNNLINIPAVASRWADWSEVTGKPSTFTPSNHTHTEAEITDSHSRYTDSEAITAVNNAAIPIDGGNASSTY